MPEVGVPRMIRLVSLGGALSAVVTVAAREETTPIEGALLLLALVGGAFALGASALARRDWFHPSAFPVLYVSVTLSFPALYLVFIGGSVGAINPSDVSGEVIAIFGLTIVGLLAGVFAGTRVRAPGSSSSRLIDPRRLRLLGRGTLFVSLVLRGTVLAANAGGRYGEGSVNFGAGQALDNLAVALFFVGCCLVVVGNLHIEGKAVGRWDLLLLAGFATPTLVSGSRGELIAPFLFVCWAHHTYVRTIGLKLLVGLTLITLVVFQGVLGIRAGESFYGGLQEGTERTLIAVGTPLLITHSLVERVPGGFSGGDTYVAAAKRQLPGPIAVAVFGPPDDTGTFVFREIMNFDSPDAGFGFSFPSESYLNFGLPGAFGAAVLAGLIVGLAFVPRPALPTRAAHLLYPVIVVWMPFALKADALAQVKTVLYPMLIFTLAFALSRSARALARPASDRRGEPKIGEGT